MEIEKCKYRQAKRIFGHDSGHVWCLRGGECGPPQPNGSGCPRPNMDWPELLEDVATREVVKAIRDAPECSVAADRVLVDMLGMTSPMFRRAVSYVKGLHGMVSALNAFVERFKGEAGEARAERDALQAELERLEAEYDDLSLKASRRVAGWMAIVARLEDHCAVLADYVSTIVPAENRPPCVMEAIEFMAAYDPMEDTDEAE